MKKDKRSNNLTAKQFKRRYRTKSHIKITKLLHPIISTFNMSYSSVWKNETNSRTTNYLTTTYKVFHLSVVIV